MVEETKEIKTVKKSTCAGYNVIRTLGFGGNAVVKLVEKDGIQYAMKMYIKEDIKKNLVKLIEDAKAEFEIVQSLNIESIIKHHEFIEHAIWEKTDGKKKQVCCVVMDYLDGVEMLDFLNECND